ncbi:hypothetical protein [Thalassoglobus polymorphus]|uniref:Uncharacterized protein n=1 Tax=Thalassoglobus polymorphus TaxID=2527994 RepID=A0A517QKW4_9PLAN|nr:hypothetical protein [Thalassoglobus polymorphus]QDT32282.1 hypothetical protein Mal48_15250 [Thalassoglobus polymorphus]
MTPYLLLADLESFFGIVVFLIALMGWIVNLVSQNQPPKNQRGPQQRRPTPRQSGVQNEIDQFLKQSRREGGRVSRPSRPSGTEEVEVISPPPSRRPPPPRRRRTRDEILAEQAGQQPPRSNPLPAKPKPTRKRPDSSQRSSIESSKSRSKQSQQASAAAAQAPQKVSQSIDEHVKSHVPHLPHVTATSSPTVIGQIGGVTKVSKRKSNKNSFAALLNSRAGIRNAVVLNEILSPPKALRNNSKD